MLNTLRMEMYNLRHSKPFRVMLFVALGFAVFTTVLFAIGESAGEASGIVALSRALWDAPLMFVLSAVFCSMFIGADFHNRTVDNQIASGHSRIQVLLGKSIAFSIGTIPIIMMSPFVRTTVYTIMFGWGGTGVGADLAYVLRAVCLSILLNISCSTVYILFAFLFKDSGKTAACSITFYLVLDLICSLLGERFAGIKTFYEHTPFSLARLAAEPTLGSSQILTAIASAVICIAVFLTLTWLSFRKSDLK